MRRNFNAPRCFSGLPARVALQKPFLGSKKQQRVFASGSDESSETASPVDDLVTAPAVAVFAAAPAKQEESMFLDPLVRSLFLGVGAGIVCETLHVVFKVRYWQFVMTHFASQRSAR
jgi:hypothetical protein